MRAFIAVAVLTAGASLAEPGGEPDKRPLRVVTYNVLHGGPASGFMLDKSHLDERLEMAARELQALEPDIIALQEVSQSRQYGDVAARMASRLGYHVAFAGATDQVFAVRPLDWLIVKALGFIEGQAILSRFPIVGVERYNLPRCQSFLDPRSVLRAELSTPWGPLQIYSTHHSREGCQTARLRDVVLANRNHIPALVMGDFNATEASPEITTLREAGFVDAFRAANPNDLGLTVWQRIEVERPTVFRRVDYIFLTNGTEATGTVRRSGLVLDKPGHLPDGRVLWPSDHYGVFAEIEILRRDPGRKRSAP